MKVYVILRTIVDEKGFIGSTWIYGVYKSRKKAHQVEEEIIQRDRDEKKPMITEIKEEFLTE